ncbi:P-loop NTPase fold protein [Stenotrophomonas geniculata]|uniref:P-loop NTPase fold protein n=2 Tax=Stenotrophomonas geniculata TaxID=86188 RepID=UPI002E790861|nr:P-loop NTPase fold protein [Stenotrophomonas geniculata]
MTDRIRKKSMPSKAEERAPAAPSEAIKSSGNEMTDRNVHVKEYLRYYLSLPTPPGFAVLLDGPWGIGKTFVIKKFLDTLDKEATPYIYVSLYGIRSVDDIDDAILQGMYPVLANKGVELGGRALKSIGKYFNVELDLKAKDFLNKSKANVYVFDDLERSEMPINTVMGYINVFVEHEGRKVILIANENEIDDKPKYKRVREKLVGKVFEVQSSLEEALQGFFVAVKDKAAKHFISSGASIISEVYHQSEMNNLRVLQQTILDFERLYIVLEERHRKNDEAMSTLLALLFALSFEVKAGRLAADDMKNRRTHIMSSYIRNKQEGYVPPKIVAVNDRYPRARVDADLFSDDTLIDLIVRGIVDQQKIRDELDGSSLFFRAEQEAAWRTVWNYHERTEEEFNAALAEMTRAFAAHEYTALGEIRHVFGIQLRLSAIGVTTANRAQVVADARAYVDYLYDQGLLEPIERQHDRFDISFDSYGGLGYMEASSAEFRGLSEYLNQKRHAAAVDRRPAIAKDLLTLMVDAPGQFLRRICLTNHEDNEFYDIPVLVALDVRKFVDAFLSLHPEKQRTVMLALKMRYQDGMIDRYLASERPWATEVRDQLRAASAAMSPVSKDRLQGVVAYGLDEALSAAEYS